MSMIYRVLSALLSYPELPLQEAGDELLTVIAGERALPPQGRLALARLVREIADGDLLDVQARYVDLFDRTRALSLHLFEHVHGESRDRGQAMVSLLERYRQAGLEMSANELPDYLPLFLEFLSLQTPDGARAMLAEPVHILAALGERLKKRGSAYAAIFEALVALSEARPDRAALELLRETKVDDPHDLAALDRAWEETEVRFGPEVATPGECPRADDMLRRMDVPQPRAEEGAGQ